MNLEALKYPFPEDEIEWRIARAGKKGNGQIWAQCLAYVSARAIMNRLDDVCGPEGWVASYQFIPASQGMEPGVICRLSIKIGGEWITKEDGAEQTDIESFKGGISSALKRAGSAWGIGRYLYGLETGWANVCDTKTNGAKYHQVKKDNLEFYWIPPNLPAEFLPDPSKAKSNGVHPTQPGAGDGVTNDIAEYLLPVGQWAKRKLSEVEKIAGIDEMRNWVTSNEVKIQKNRAAGKPVTNESLWLDAIERMAAYIGERELDQVS